MALTGTDYRRQLQALLPRGAAWTRALGAVLTRVLDAIAQEFARIDARARRLIDEAIPTTTTELLPDWERVAGLPDNCSGVLRDTLQGRRLDLVSKLAATGGQTPAYYREVARALGYVVTIEEFRPFRVGSRVGGRLYDEPWHHAWQITAPNTHMTYFRAGQSRVGERLRAWGNQALECRINQLKPAHTVVIFAYRDGQEVLLLADGTPLLLTDGEGGLLLAQQTVN